MKENLAASLVVALGVGVLVGYLIRRGTESRFGGVTLSDDGAARIARPGLPLDIEPMEAKLVDELPDGDWQYEPKWDGFRCLAFSAGGDVDLKAKSGKPLARLFSRDGRDAQARADASVVSTASSRL